MASFIAVPVKQTNEIDVTKPIKKFIANTYSNAKPEDYENAVVEFNKLRNLSIQKSLVNHESALEVLYRYYDQLGEMEAKLPISSFQIPINFKWRDAFDTDSMFARQRNLAIMSGAYERICVMFNIAALQSQIAAGQNPESDDGRKLAAKLFQQAAGIFDVLKNTVCGTLQQEVTTDLTSEALGALSTLMLAQAQETIYRKASADKMKEGTVAKLAYQCSEFYADAMKQLQSTSNFRDLIPRDWIPITTMKQAAFHALAEYNQSLIAQKNKSYGEEIARLKKASGLLAASQTRGGSGGFPFSNEQGRIKRALEAAIKDNDFIYHDRVPEANELTPIASLGMAKPIAPQKLMSSGFTDLFAKLVPLQVHYAITAFDNRRATVVQVEVGRMREGTQLMNSILASLNLPAAQEDLTGKQPCLITPSILASLNLPAALEDVTGKQPCLITPSILASLNLPAALEDVTGKAVPESLLEKGQKVKDGGGIQFLEGLLHDMPVLLKRNRDILDEACSQIETEETSDSQLRQQFGEKWKRTPSITLTAPMKEEASKYRNILDRAVHADRMVNDKFNAHSKVIGILSQSAQEMEKAIPSANPTSALKNSPVLGELRKLMDDVDAIRAEREAMEAQINEATFDINSIFMKALMDDGAIDEENISTAELNKVYSTLREQITESLSRQEMLMGNVQAANTKFCEAKQSSGAATSRETVLKDFAAGYDMFEELKKNLVEGTKFYNDLTPLLVKFQSKVTDFCFARKTEKEELLADLNKTIANQPAQTTPNAPKYQTQSAEANRPVPAPRSNQPQQQPPPQQQQQQQQQHHSYRPQNILPTSAAVPSYAESSAPAASAPTNPTLPYSSAPPANYGGTPGYPTSPPVPVAMPMPAGYNPYMSYNPYGQQPPQQPYPYPYQGYPQPGAPSYPQNSQQYPQQPPYPQQSQYPTQYPSYNTQQWR